MTPVRGQMWPVFIGTKRQDAVGMLDADDEADDAAPVVADEVHAVQAERVEHADDVLGELVLAVAARRRLAPAEAAQVEREHAEVGA